MNVEMLPNPASVAQRAASTLAAQAGEAVAARGTFVLAVSGGHIPWLMLRTLADENVPWQAAHVLRLTNG